MAGARVAGLGRPAGLALNPAGDLFIADQWNSLILKMSRDVITTVAGNGANGFAGDGGRATDAQLSYPAKIAVNAFGWILIADPGNGRVRILPPAFDTVSAASFAKGRAAAPEQIASGFGAALTTVTQGAAEQPLPTALLGVTVTVRDSLGVERPSPLFFVSPTQINYLIPQGTAAGQGTATVTSQGRVTAIGSLTVEAVAPGLFTANFAGSGVASAVAVWVKPDGSQTWQYVFQCGSTVGSCVDRPVDVGAETDKLYLYLYGTGIRGRSSLSAVTATIAGVSTVVEYAGAAPGFTGLDQVNLLVPRSVFRGPPTSLLLTVDGKYANSVGVTFR
jgi:uncharacterized protein (TIGR03437 family)